MALTQKQRPKVVAYNQPKLLLPNSFIEGRFMPDFHPDSLDYEQWVAEQHRRCLHGWSDGGYSVTGVHYYHLNFKKINMDSKADATGRKRPIIYHPYFSFEDQELFNNIQTARDEGKGMFLITGRGFGKSFDVSSLVEHEFTFYPASESIVSASILRFADLLWEKIELGLNSQPEWLKQNLLTDTSTEKFSGWEETNALTRQKRVEGYQSIIRKVVYDSDPEKTRGTRPSIHVWEEVGSWTGAATLLACYKKTEPSWWRGSRFSCFPIFIGTGGAMDTGGSVDAKLMFQQPSVYNLMEFINEMNEKVGKFFPAFKKFGGFYEESGKSDEEGAWTFLQKRRERKKADPSAYRQETMEFPFNWREAFQVAGTGLLPTDMLEQRYMRLEAEPGLQIVQKGFLDWVREGNKITGVEWRPAKEGEEGIFEIAEHPIWTRRNQVIPKMSNLYVGGCDSFDAVEEEINGESQLRMDKSPGSLFIFKRFWKVSETGRLFVAKITQRTADASEFYWNTIKLNLYYNCKMLGEYTKTGIFQHYIREGFANLLYERPRLDSTVVKESSATNRYGLAMPIQVKLMIIRQYREYILQNCDLMYFPSQVLDAANFTLEGRDKGKHDETMAASLALAADIDMFKVSIQEKEKQDREFPIWQTDARGNMVFAPMKKKPMLH